MSDPTRIHLWPRTMPIGLEGLADAIARLQPDCELVPVTDLAEIGRMRNGDDTPASIVIVIDPAVASGSAFGDEFHAAADGLRRQSTLNTVIVVGDGYLGTDGTGTAAAMYGASAVSLIRSLALTRDRPGRSNVVVVPDGMIGPSGSQRGPLKQPTEIDDVAHAICYLLGPTGSYVSGQTLFVNGGRHLFSSQTA